MNRGESQQQFASPGEALEHYGVKGMRKGHGKPNRIDRKNGRDPKRLAILYGRRGKKEPFAIQYMMAGQVNGGVGKINKRYEDEDFSNVDWANPSSWDERTREYHAEILALATKSDRAAIKAATGVMPKKKRRAELNETGDQLVIRDVEVRHAEDDDVAAVLKITRDSRGLIIKVEPLEQEDQTTKGEGFVTELLVKRA